MEENFNIPENKYQAWTSLVRKSLNYRETVKIMLEDNSMVRGIIIECSEMKKVKVFEPNVQYSKEIPWVVLVECENSWIELKFSNILYFTT